MRLLRADHAAKAMEHVLGRIKALRVRMEEAFIEVTASAR